MYHTPAISPSLLTRALKMKTKNKTKENNNHQKVKSNLGVVRDPQGPGTEGQLKSVAAAGGGSFKRASWKASKLPRTCVRWSF